MRHGLLSVRRERPDTLPAFAGHHTHVFTELPCLVGHGDLRAASPAPGGPRKEDPKLKASLGYGARLFQTWTICLGIKGLWLYLSGQLPSMHKALESLPGVRTQVEDKRGLCAAAPLPLYAPEAWSPIKPGGRPVASKTQ